MSDYQRMLYRKGDESSPELHGLHCETLIVDTSQEEAAAAAKGWRRTPAEAHGEKSQLPDDQSEALTAANDEVQGLLQEIEELRAAAAVLRAERDAAAKERDETRELLKAFDGDGDGRAGGSKPKLSIKGGKDS